MNWGRFTAKGPDAAEAAISSILSEAAEILRNHLAPGSIRGVYLIGGYGKSEGGFIIENGAYRPHNNFDLLVVTRFLAFSSAEETKNRTASLLAPVAKKYRIQFDIAAISDWKLRNSEVLLMWYDMKEGHKCLVGDEAFLSETDRFSLDRVPAWDLQNLIVNRGTLLIINDALLADHTGVPSEDIAKIVIRHLMKAIIGYGDAFLFFDGRYHWSYREKLRRIHENPAGLPEGFADMYETAAAFRFEPDYTRFQGIDLLKFQNEVRSMLKEVHFICEQKRLGPSFTSWDDYASLARRDLHLETFSSLRRAIRGILELARQLLSGVPLRELTAVAPRRRLSLAFPRIAYLPDDSRDGRRSRLEYLMSWGNFGDTNFPQLVEKLKLLSARSE